MGDTDHFFLIIFAVIVWVLLTAIGFQIVEQLIDYTMSTDWMKRRRFLTKQLNEAYRRYTMDFQTMKTEQGWNYQLGDANELYIQQYRQIYKNLVKLYGYKVDEKIIQLYLINYFNKELTKTNKGNK